MKQYCFLLLFFLGSWLSLPAQVTKPAKANLNQILKDFHQRPDYVMVAAHRAAHNKYPENSLAAIRETIRLGVDIVELDVRETKDSVLVIMHDRTITRTTGQPGDVSSYTYEELKKFPLLHNGQPTAERIPTFKEALLLAKDRIIVDIDFKAGSREAAQKTYALIKETQTLKQVLFFIYDHQDAPFLQSLDKRLPIMPRAHNAAETDTILQMGKFPVIHADPSFYTDSLMLQIRKAGSRVWMNALGKFDALEKETPDAGFTALLDKFKYTNVIQTDFPEQLLQYLRKRGLHR